MSKVPEIVLKRLKSELSELDDEQFKIYLRGYEAAHNAACFASGVMGTDVIVGISAFKKRLPGLRERSKP